MTAEHECSREPGRVAGPCHFPRRSSSAVLVAITLAQLFAAASPASAKGRPKPPPPQLSPEESRLRVAQETFTRGVELYEKGEIAKAEEQLKLAAQLAPGKPKPFYYLGRVFVEMGRCPEALANLDIYFRLSSSDHENRAHANEMKAKCENEIARKGGTLLIDTTPDGAAVMIDEENAIPAGVTPFGTDRLATGSHVVFLRKPGFQKVVRTVNLVTGQLVRLVVVLEAEHAAPVAEAPKPVVAPPPPPPPVVTPPPAPKPEPPPPPVVAKVEPKPEPKPEPPKPKPEPVVVKPLPPPGDQLSSQRAHMRSAGVALLVVGVVGGAAGGVTAWLLGRDAADRDNAALSFQAGGAAQAQGSPYSALMITSIAAGTALAATGALLIGLSTRQDASRGQDGKGAASSKPVSSLIPIVAPSVDGALVGVAGRFE